MPDPGPRWLDEDELRAWRAVMAMLTLLPAALEQQLRRDCDLGTFEYHVLAMLSEAPGGTRRMGELAILANGSLSRLSHGAKRLEAQGLLRREASPGDGRYTNAVLTEAGRARLEAAAPGHVETVRRLVFDQLTRAQVLRLGDAARRIVEGIEAGGDRIVQEDRRRRHDE